MVNFCLPAERPLYTSCGTHTGGFEVKNNIALTVMVLIASFKVIGELHRERLHHSHAAAFSWNVWPHGQLLQVNSWVPSSLPRHRLHSVFSGRHLLYRRSRHALRRLVKFPNSQKSWENWACKNSVYQALFPAPPCKSLGTRLTATQWLELSHRVAEWLGSSVG